MSAGQLWFGRPAKPPVPTYNTLLASYHPLGWWKLDETSGTTAHDSSGNGYDGTITGATVGDTSDPPPMQTSAFNFNSVGEVLIASGFAPSGLTRFSIIQWIDVIPATWAPCVFANGVMPDGFETFTGVFSYYNCSMECGMSGATEYTHNVDIGSNAGWLLEAYSIDSTVPAGTTFVYSPSYPDGSNSGASTITRGTVLDAGGQARIGSAVPNSGLANFPGRICQVAFLADTALTATQVKALYDAATGV